MQTIFCNGFGFSPEHAVCFRRTISGNDMELRTIADGYRNGMEEIKEFFMDGFNFI
jgi:hypothetical protein